MGVFFEFDKLEGFNPTLFSAEGLKLTNSHLFNLIPETLPSNVKILSEIGNKIHEPVEIFHISTKYKGFIDYNSLLIGQSYNITK